MSMKKRIAAGAMACATLASTMALTGCGTAYALKTDNAEISTGVYRYCLFYAYQNVKYSTQDYTQPILSKDFDGQTGEELVREMAETYVKPFLVIEDKMKELNLSLDDLTRYNAENSVDSTWSSYKEMFEPYGITKSDYQYITYDYSAKYSRVFEAIYGEGGEKEVSREDMETYFNKNYSDVQYISISTSNDDGTERTDEELAALKKELKGYATKINNGELTMEEADAAYTDKHTEKTEDEEVTASAAEGEEDTTSNSNLHHSVGIISTTKNYPEKMVTAVEKLKNGKATFVDASDSGYLILIQKNNIKDAVSDYFDNEDTETKESNIFQILADMKEEEYTAYMNDLAENYDMSKVTWNAAESTDLDLRALFEPDSVTSEEASSPEETTSSKTEQSAAEDAASAASTASSDE